MVIVLAFCVVLVVWCLRWLWASWRRARRRNSSHRWRIEQSVRLISRLQQIGKQRGPGAQIAYLRKVDPLVVEELILTALQSRGYPIKRNSHYSGDGGVDGRCWIDGELHFIQCKRYRSSILPEHVRQFSALCARSGARGLFIHTGRTGPLSREHCVGTVVSIISGTSLLELLGVVSVGSETREERRADGTSASQRTVAESKTVGSESQAPPDTNYHRQNGMAGEVPDRRRRNRR